MDEKQMTHLKELEAESIHIVCEVIAEFDNLTMSYGVGKNSSVMLHLVQKAFYPASPPSPLVHANTTWKFHEMIEFRDRQAREHEVIECGGAKIMVDGGRASDELGESSKIKMVRFRTLGCYPLAGALTSGNIKVGDEVVASPSLKSSTIKQIIPPAVFPVENSQADKEILETIDEAFTPMAVTLMMEDETDIGRGDMIVHNGSIPEVSANNGNVEI